MTFCTLFILKIKLYGDLKKINFLSIGFLFGLSAFGQAPSKETFGATAPKQAIKIDKEHLVTILHQSRRQSTVPTDNENTYQLDGLLISYWGLSVNADYHKTLEESQSEILGYLKGDKENNKVNSKIIAVNNIKFLIYEYQRNDQFYLRFKSEFDKNYHNINGV